MIGSRAHHSLTQFLEIQESVVLNIDSHNNDDHLHNHAFVYDTAQKGWRLSPLYDVLPMNTVATERFLHLNVGAQGRLATLDNALSKWPAGLRAKAGGSGCATPGLDEHVGLDAAF